MLLLFYSLATHMYWSLGQWPETIGEEGFPLPLIIHAAIAWGSFAVLVLASIFVWPFAFLACLVIKSWRGGIPYMGIYVLSLLVCFGLMCLAPSKFLYWWWD